MKPHEIAALNLQTIARIEEFLRDLDVDWNLRMALIQWEKVERDTLSNYIEDTRAAEKEGREEGGTEVQRANLLQLLEHRGVAVSPEQRARISACEDLGRLSAWFTQAFHCQSADELR